MLNIDLNDEVKRTAIILIIEKFYNLIINIIVYCVKALKPEKKTTSCCFPSSIKLIFI